jgi:hypothetical protein
LDAAALRVSNRALLAVVLGLLVAVGFGFRAAQLGAEGLSEDELNKLQATQDYRAHGLTPANGEHPFLMKALQTVSAVAAERWNAVAPAGARLSVEGALRLPTALFGAFTSLLIFLLVRQLFGPRVALLAAALWALDPSAIGFNRIAKEDSFYIFFFLLANTFWLRGQRAAEAGEMRPERWYWATAAALGAMFASKYLPHFISITASYYYVFQNHPRTRWRLGKAKWLAFFALMGAVFLLCNPTILLPGTWHEMKIFAGEKRIGHDAYEFMGQLYRNQVSLWLKGSPWYFYYVFIGVKIPLPTVAAFLVGLPLLFRRRLLGVGRFFILFWLFYFFLPFTFMGGKFTRYFTLGLPAVLITAAVGLDYAATLAGRWLKYLTRNQTYAGYAYATLVALVLLAPAYAAAAVAPHFRLYTNALGGGWQRAGDYFPHDEFYDANMPQAAAEICARARPDATVASETPGLFTYYATRAGRADLVSVSLSDTEARAKLRAGDFVIVARGRRYFSNDAYLKQLQQTRQPFAILNLGPVSAVKLYQLPE